MGGALCPEDVCCGGAGSRFCTEASAFRLGLGTAWPERFLKKPVDASLIISIIEIAAHVL
jgi:hypothetical protein